MRLSVAYVGVFPPDVARNRRQRATTRRRRTRYQVAHSHRRRSLLECDVRLPLRRLWKMVPTAQSRGNKADEKVDRSATGSMGANEKTRGDDKRRSFRSDHDATMLHAKRPPGNVRVSRLLPFPKTRLMSSNPFVLEPYRKRIKRCAGCLSEFLHDTRMFVVSKREWHTYLYAGHQCQS